MRLAQEQSGKSLNNLQHSINICRNMVYNSIKDIKLSGSDDSLLEQAALLQVIYFTLNKLDLIIKQHKKLAIVAINDQDQIDTSTDLSEQLIQLISLSALTFKDIDDMRNVCTEKSKKYQNISDIALRLTLAISGLLVVGGIVIFIASMLATSSTMPILFFCLAALAGADLISIAIGYSSEKHAKYLKYDKIPREISSSSNEFYKEDELDIIPEICKDRLNCYKLSLYLTPQDSQKPELIPVKLDKERYLIDLEPPEQEYQIHYLLKEYEWGPSKYTIYYRRKNDLFTESFLITLQQKISEDKIKAAILKHILENRPNKSHTSFFSNAITKILPETGQQTCLITPDAERISSFEQTVGLK